MITGRVEHSRYGREKVATSPDALLRCDLFIDVRNDRMIELKGLRHTSREEVRMIDVVKTAEAHALARAVAQINAEGVLPDPRGRPSRSSRFPAAGREAHLNENGDSLCRSAWNGTVIAEPDDAAVVERNHCVRTEAIESLHCGVAFWRGVEVCWSRAEDVFVRL